MEKQYNTKENSKHFKGKIWINGGNICAELSNGSLIVVEWMDNEDRKDIEGSVRKALVAYGWKPEDWLGE